jgi:protein-S-isoprenylcysteine O-methyltransferase Ste14
MEPPPNETEAAEPPAALKVWSHFHWIMVALLVWGGYLAIGAFKNGGNAPTIRGLIVFGCVLAFLAFWLAALAVRQRRMGLAAQAADEEEE